MASVNIQGYIPGARCNYIMKMRQLGSSPTVENLGDITPLNADDKDIVITGEFYCERTCIPETVPTETVVGTKSQTYNSFRGWQNDLLFTGGDTILQIRVHAVNPAAVISVPLNPATATLVGAGGTVLPAELVYDPLAPMVFVVAIETAIQNYLDTTLGYVRGTNYEFRVGIPSVGRIEILFCNKHQPTGTWLGSQIFNSNLTYVLGTGGDQYQIGSYHSLIAQDPGNILCEKNITCGVLSLEGTFDGNFINIASDFQNIDIVETTAQFFITRQGNVTCSEFCFFPVHDCIDLCFTGNNVMNTIGVPASITFNTVEIADVMVGSVLTVNNIAFTFAAAEDTCTNTILYDANLANLLLNISNVLSSNYGVCKLMDVQHNNPPGEVVLTALNCITDLSVSFTNLDNSAGDIELEQASTQVDVKNPYKICVELRCGDDTYELEIYPTLELTSDFCEVEDVQICKDISSILRACLFTPLPACVEAQSQTDLVLHIDSMRKTVNWDFAEVYGLPNNIYSKREGYPFTIYNGVTQDGEAGHYEARCNAGQGLTQLYLTHYRDGDNVCLEQCNFVYFDLDDRPSHTIQQTYEFYDSAGFLLHTLNYPLGTYRSGTLQIATGIPQVCALLVADGFAGSLNDIKSYTVTTADLAAPQNRVATISYNVTCCQEFEEFLFLTSEGTYQTITTRPIRNASLVTIREWINVCQPCLPGKQDRSRKMLNSDQYRTYVANIEPGFHSVQLIEQFLTSTDVYWRFQGELYWIEPLTNNFIDLVNDREVPTPFNFRVHSLNNFTQ